MPVVFLLLCCCNSLQPVFNSDTSYHFDIQVHVNSVVPSRGKHVGARVQFYANSVATFQILLLISGDINPNPGPTIKNGQAILANDHNLDTCTYDSPTLHSINSVCSSSSKKCCEDNNIVWNRIVSLGISRGRRTHRGKRGGRDILKDHLKLMGHLKFGVLNARSLRNKSTIFQDFVLDRRLDFVCICETWLSSSDDAVIADLCPGGYVFEHRPRLSRRGGGVAFLYKDHLQVAVKPPDKYDSFEFNVFNCYK